MTNHEQFRDKAPGSSSGFQQSYLRWARRIEGRKNHILAVLARIAYRPKFLRGLVMAAVRRLEGKGMAFVVARSLLKEFHEVEVGRHSYGACLVPGVLPPGTTMGNYCSVADGLQVFRRNHPVKHLSQHPYFFNKELGLLREDAIVGVRDNPLRIGHDVWIGAGVTILPGCACIGNGAVIGAGSVVTHDIQPYSINVGNPARRIAHRFEEEVQELIERTQWWLLPLEDLRFAGQLLFAPVERAPLEEFLSRLRSENEPEYQLDH